MRMAQATAWIQISSPGKLARVGGVLFVLFAFTVPFNLVSVPKRLTVKGRVAESGQSALAPDFMDQEQE